MEKKAKTTIHPLVLISLIVLIVTALTYVVPAGTYERAMNEVTKRVSVVPGTFKFIEQTPVSLGTFLLSFQKGIIGAANVVGFLLLIGGGFGIVNSTGAIEALMAQFITKFKSAASQNMLIFGLLTFFALSGAVYGMALEALIFAPFLMGLMVALKYDAVLGVAIPIVGTAIGYGASIMNPFNIGIAQEIAELPYLSGMWFRVVFFVVSLIVAGLYLINYAKKVKKSPELSICYGIEYDFEKIENPESVQLTKKHKNVLLIFLLSIVVLIYGAMFKSFFMNECATVFLVMGVTAGIVNGYGASEIAEHFSKGAQSMIIPVLLVSFARGIIEVLEAGQIMDTIIYYAVSPLETFSPLVSAPLMVLVQTFINLLINSGSGQAMVTMPIMVPIADLLNINRQVAVLAFQIGDGFSNMFWFTSGSVLIGLGLAKVGYMDWVKFIWKLIAILTVIGMLATSIAQFINLGPM